MSNSEALRQIIIEKIEKSSQQRISFADYMNLVLYHQKYGYYSSGKVNIGSKGDYFTASSLGSDFGELLAIQLIDIWQILGENESFTWVEMGAGLGLFARDLLSYLQSHYSQYINKLNYLIIEESPALIEQQKQLLDIYRKNGININWKSWHDLADLSINGCFFSNELVDAFPVHKIVIKDRKLQEIYVTYQEHQFQEIIGDLSTEAIREYFQLIDIDILNDAYPDGYTTEVNLSALSWLEKVSQKLQRGYVITIDYGYPASKYYHPQRYQGTLKCYYQHHHHDNPYINIGQQDLTSHVDFTALEKQGELQGLDKLAFTQQGLFLMALGLGDRLKELSSGKYNIMEIFQRRDSLHQLIDPTGLGGFGILIQSKGLTKAEKQQKIKGIIEH